MKSSLPPFDREEMGVADRPRFAVGPRRVSRIIRGSWSIPGVWGRPQAPRRAAAQARSRRARATASGTETTWLMSAGTVGAGLGGGDRRRGVGRRVGSGRR